MNKAGKCAWFSWSKINTSVYSVLKAEQCIGLSGICFLFPYCGHWTDAMAGVGCRMLPVDGQSRSVAGWGKAEPPPGSLWLVLCLAEVSEPASVLHTWPPTGTLSTELLALRTYSAGSVIRHNFIAVTYIACGLNHMVILLCSISACLFFIFPHPLHLLLAAFPAPFLQRGSYINRSL